MDGSCRVVKEVNVEQRLQCSRSLVGETFQSTTSFIAGKHGNAGGGGENANEFHLIVCWWWPVSFSFSPTWAS